MKKLNITKYKKLEGIKWDNNNYIEEIRETDSEYIIDIWRTFSRQIVILNRNEEVSEDANVYKIGIYESHSNSVEKPFYIKLKDIEDMNVFMSKLKLLTDKWTLKFI